MRPSGRKAHLYSRCKIGRWLWAALAILAAAAPLSIAAETGGLHVAHRSGQTFLTWRESEAASYRVYASEKAITRAHIEQALLLAELPPGSGRDPYLPAAVRQDPAAAGLYEPSMQILEEGGAPLDVGTGLFVAAIQEAGKRYYAVAHINSGGDITRVDALDAPVAETPGMPALLQLGSRFEDAPDPAFRRYRTEFVHWSTPAMCHRPSVPFHLAVLTKEPLDSARAYTLVFSFYGFGGGYENLGYPIPNEDEMVVLPSCYYPFLREVNGGDSWWRGYVPALADPDSDDLAWHDFDGERLNYYYEELSKRFHGVPEAAWAWGAGAGAAGAIHFAMNTPARFRYVAAQTPVLDPATSADWVYRQLAPLYGAPSALPDVYSHVSLMERIQQPNADTPPLLLQFGVFDSITDRSVVGRFLGVLDQRRLPGMGVMGLCGEVFDSATAPRLPYFPSEFRPTVVLSHLRIESWEGVSSSTPIEVNQARGFRTRYQGYVLTDEPERCTVVIYPLGGDMTIFQPEDIATRVKVSADQDPDGRFDIPFLPNASERPVLANGEAYPAYWSAPLPAWMEVDLGAPRRVCRIELAPPPGYPPLDWAAFQAIDAEGNLMLMESRRDAVSTFPGSWIHVYRLKPAVTSRVRISFNSPSDRALRVGRIQVFGTPPEEEAIADVTLRGLATFPMTGAVSYECRDTARPERVYTVAPWEHGALSIENVRIEGETILELHAKQAPVDAEASAPPSAKPGCLQNGGFEIWEDGLPKGWNGAAANQPYVRRMRGQAPEGESCLLLYGQYYFMNLSQTLDGYGPLAGKQVTVSVRIQSFEKDSASVSVHQEDLGDLYSEPHPGDGLWHELRVSFRVPEFSVHDSFIVSIGNGNLPRQPCYFDDVQVHVE